MADSRFSICRDALVDPPLDFLLPVCRNLVKGDLAGIQLVHQVGLFADFGQQAVVFFFCDFYTAIACADGDYLVFRIELCVISDAVFSGTTIQKYSFVGTNCHEP